MCVLSIKYIVLVLSREDEQINSLFGFVHHHKDIPFHLAFCPATRAKGASVRGGGVRGSLARVYARVRRFLFFAFTPSPVCPKWLSVS